MKSLKKYEEVSGECQHSVSMLYSWDLNINQTSHLHFVFFSVCMLYICRSPHTLNRLKPTDLFQFSG